MIHPTSDVTAATVDADPVAHRCVESGCRQQESCGASHRRHATQRTFLKKLPRSCGATPGRSGHHCSMAKRHAESRDQQATMEAWRGWGCARLASAAADERDILAENFRRVTSSQSPSAQADACKSSKFFRLWLAWLNCAFACMQVQCGLCSPDSCSAIPLGGFSVYLHSLGRRGRFARKLHFGRRDALSPPPAHR